MGDRGGTVPTPRPAPAGLASLAGGLASTLFLVDSRRTRLNLDHDMRTFKSRLTLLPTANGATLAARW